MLRVSRRARARQDGTGIDMGVNGEPGGTLISMTTEGRSTTFAVIAGGTATKCATGRTSK
ncbi:hypothetical protein [Streptomyces griseoluteus]|uniref:hypothetical protein n=1 Tax=Streptomyces griseoluteus TaxID=29306 RepID=UPI0036E7A3F4